MNCRGFQNRYDAYMADDLSDSLAAEIEEHLAICSDCREWYESQQAIGEALRAEADSLLPPPQYFEGLYQRVEPRLERARRWDRFCSTFISPIQAFFFSATPTVRFARATALCTVGLGLGTALSMSWTPNASETSAKAQSLPTNGSWALASVGFENPAAPVAVAPPFAPSKSVTVEKSADGVPAGVTLGPPHARLVSSIVPTSGNEWPGAFDATADYREEDSAPPAGLPVAVGDGATVNIARKFREYSIFEELQAAKLELYRLGNTKLMHDLESIEHKMIELWQMQDEEETDYHRQMALYQEAQDAYIGGDIGVAHDRFLKVVAINNESRWACIAQFELASLYYDNLHDFGKALQYYSSCANDYSEDFLTDLQREQLEIRLSNLQTYKAYDYRPLQLYQTARTAETTVAIQALFELTREYPHSALAQTAVLELTRMAVDEKLTEGILFLDIYEEFGKGMKDRSGPLAAHFQFAMAEVRNFRLHEYQEARDLYIRARLMSDDPELRAMAAQRLKTQQYR